jgi:hypothetical protein
MEGRRSHAAILVKTQSSRHERLEVRVLMHCCVAVHNKKPSMDEAATSAPELYKAFVRYVALQARAVLLLCAQSRCCAPC